MSLPTEYLAMVIIGGIIMSIGFIGICISIVSLFITHLSIYSKTFFIISIIMFVIGLVLLIVGFVVSASKAVNNIKALSAQTQIPTRQQPLTQTLTTEEQLRLHQQLVAQQQKKFGF